MNVDVKPEKNKQIDIEITIDEFILNKHLKSSASKISNSTNISGFRKGKVPYSIIEAKFGRDYILNNSLDDIIQDVVPDILSEQKLEYPCSPKVDILQKEPKFIISLQVPMMPEVALGDYKSLNNKQKKEKITKKKIDETIDRILESRATWEENNITLDFPGLAKINILGKYNEQEVIKHENYDFYAVKDSKLIVPGMSEKLKGIKKGEKRDFTLTLPNDWDNQDLKGKNVNFTIDCIEVLEKKLPTLDDEFVKLFNKNLKTVKEFEEEIKKELNSELNYKYRIELENQLLSDLIEISKYKISSIQIETATNQVIEERMKSISQYKMSLEDYLKAINMKEEEFYNESKKSAEQELKKIITLEEIIIKEDIQVENKEVKEEITLIKQNYADQKLVDDENLYKIVENNLKKKNSMEYLIKLANKAIKNRKK
ncbi:MAG: trigger factor [Chloroflexi bacterium]|nr:trigger factor [Chloroflexota bacterium]|tara:strand:+ start:862 stop:2148 length:1287 start_codon:yes stop_codon:yes gene_type:complete